MSVGARMRGLGLDADAVPIVYRIRVTDPDGEVLAETTVMVVPSRIDPLVANVRLGYADAGMPDVTIDTWPA